MPTIVLSVYIFVQTSLSNPLFHSLLIQNTRSNSALLVCCYVVLFAHSNKMLYIE